MPRPGPCPSPLPRALACAALAVGLAGCAEMHHGVEAVGRVGGTPAPVAEVDVPVGRTDVKTVRPPGSPRRPAAEEAADVEAPRSTVVASAVPSPRQIFDFHPAGSSPDAWRQPFIIDTNDGPLAADVRRSSAELRSFLADQKAGRDKATTAAKPRCGETDIAQAKPGCVGAHAAAVAIPAAPAPQ